MIMKPRFYVVVALITIVAGSALVLSSRTIAAPTHKIEKTLPNDRFIK